MFIRLFTEHRDEVHSQMMRTKNLISAQQVTCHIRINTVLALPESNV